MKNGERRRCCCFAFPRLTLEQDMLSPTSQNASYEESTSFLCSTYTVTIAALQGAARPDKPGRVVFVENSGNYMLLGGMTTSALGINTLYNSHPRSSMDTTKREQRAKWYQNVQVLQLHVRTSASKSLLYENWELGDITGAQNHLHSEYKRDVQHSTGKVVLLYCDRGGTLRREERSFSRAYRRRKKGGSLPHPQSAAQQPYPGPRCR